MGNFSNLEVISEFTNNEITYGIYGVKFKGTSKIFIRNGKSIGVVAFMFGEPATKCISEIREDIREEFLNFLKQQKGG